MLFKPRPKTTGELIRQARELRGWSAHELAQRVGYSPQTIYRWEWDACRVTERKLTELALVLHVPIGSLRGVPPPEAETAAE